MKQHHDYTPIACGLHSAYELAIMHKRLLQLAWRDQNNNVIHKRLLPLDISTREHAEFLLARDDNGVVYEIRLDRILQSDVEQTGND